jgi:hypothetical protein
MVGCFRMPRMIMNAVTANKKENKRRGEVEP